MLLVPQYYGHDNLRLLDGGRKKWELDSVTRGDVPERAATTYVAKDAELDPCLPDEVVSAIGQNLIDVRSPTSTPDACWLPRTSRRGSPDGGHIPGRQRPVEQAANATARFRDDDELKELTPSRLRQARHHRLLPHR